MVKKIKILQFPIANTNGGVTRSVINWWKYIDHEKFEFGFATCSKKLYFEKKLIDSGAKVHYISCRAEENYQHFCDEIESILKEYDIVHISTLWWKSFAVEEMAKKLGVKVIIHAHNGFIDESKCKGSLKNELSRHEECKKELNQNIATHFLACSKKASDFLYGSQIDGSKIVFFYNPIDISKYNFDMSIRKQVRTTLELNDKFVLGMVGRLVPVKNHEFGIKCLKTISQYVDNAYMIIVGDGYMKDYLQKKSYEYGIEDRLIFTGAIEDVERYMNAMDIFLFPSFNEGLGNVLIEAQATGLKCIANTTVPIETRITDNVTYLELDEQQWVDEILKYVHGYQRNDKTLEIKKAGFDIVEEIKKLEKIYIESVN